MTVSCPNSIRGARLHGDERLLHAREPLLGVREEGLHQGCPIDVHIRALLLSSIAGHLIGGQRKISARIADRILDFLWTDAQVRWLKLPDLGLDVVSRFAQLQWARKPLPMPFVLVAEDSS